LGEEEGQKGASLFCPRAPACPNLSPLQIVDLDTIDVSNLNRQFLFRPHHVGLPKAVVAREAALAWAAPSAASTIVAHHANVKEARFGIGFFDRFDVVINALDNVSARRHVNRLCLAADKPLVEAGTQGYLGQAFVIKKGRTECFECEPKATQTKYPVCTIRSTPDKPVHCVVWAKELYKLLLGDASSSYLYEEETNNAGGAAAAAAAAGAAGAAAPAEAAADAATDAAAGQPRAGVQSVYMHLITGRPQGGLDAAAATTYARAVFRAIFHDEIARRLEVAPDAYKTAAHPPSPLELEVIEGVSASASASAAAASPASSPPPPPPPPPPSSSSSPSVLPDQRVPTLKESAALFLAALARFFTDPAYVPALGTLDFSKDSAADLDLVTAATNLRAHTFGIPAQSRFDVKSIAGNIIPAIATTNAIVAGLEVVEALKLLDGQDVLEACRYTWCNRNPSGRRRQLLCPTKLQRPNPKCVKERSARTFTSDRFIHCPPTSGATCSPLPKSPHPTFPPPFPTPPPPSPPTPQLLCVRVPGVHRLHRHARHHPPRVCRQGPQGRAQLQHPERGQRQRVRLPGGARGGRGRRGVRAQDVLPRAAPRRPRRRRTRRRHDRVHHGLLPGPAAAAHGPAPLQGGL
jgi:ubiquitin-like 1-activating enzyme E1 B